MQLNSTSEGEPLKGSNHCSQAALHGGMEAKSRINEECHSVADTDAFLQCSPLSGNLSRDQCLLLEMENLSGYDFHQNTPNRVMKSSEVVSIRDELGSKSEIKGSNSIVSSKGSHIRKSLQSIGKLINGSERR